MKVGIIGAGTMGSGIAQAFAQVEGDYHEKNHYNNQYDKHRSF